MEERLAGEEKEGTRGLGRICTEMSAEYEILLPALQGGCAVAARNLTSQVAERESLAGSFRKVSTSIALYQRMLRGEAE